MSGDSPEEPTLKRFLQICDPALLSLLAEYVSRLIGREEEPELRSMRFLISLESLERLRGKEPGRAFFGGLRELSTMLEELRSRYPKEAGSE